MIVDASGKIFGRLCSLIAKKLVAGEEVNVINADKAVIVGKEENIMARYRSKVERGDPHHGPFYARTPDRMLKRAVRGMINDKKTTGRLALKKLKVYNGNPMSKKGEMMGKDVSEINTSYLTLDDVSKKLRGMA